MKLLNISVKRPSVVNKLITSSTASTSRFQSSWDNTSSSSSHSNSSNSEKTTINSYGRTVPSSSSYSPRFNRDHPPHSSSKPANQRFKKQVAPLFNPPPTEKELGKREEMRVKRAERLERKDLTAQLTETKTCMCYSFITTFSTAIQLISCSRNRDTNNLHFFFPFPIFFLC